MVLIAMAVIVVLPNTRFAHAQTIYTINPNSVLHRVDEKVYGHFLEHIYNSVNGGLWGDLVWNRSLERFAGTSGTWRIEGDQVVQSSPNENVRLLFGETSWQNYEYTLEARKDGGAEGFLILFRANGEDFYWCNLGGWSNTLHAIEKGTPGVRWGVFGSQISGSIQSGRWYQIRIRCEGNHFQVWLDGSELFNFSDNTSTVHLSGQVGVGTWVTQARYRNFLVTDIASGDTLFSGLPTVVESEVNLLNWQKVGAGALHASGQALNSNFCITVVNSQSTETGIQQSSLDLKNQTYRGSLWAKGSTPANLKVSLLSGGTVLAQETLAAPGPDWQEYPFQLTPTTETTNGTLRISFSDTGTVYLDQISMMGQDAIDNDGFRPGLYQAVEALRPPVIRWPGGYFAELYRWKDGIGPQHERTIYPVVAWNDQDVNSFGTDEFVTLCRRLGAEPLIVINTGHRSSSVPQAEYIEEAQHWVEYCNGPASSTWGSKRAANGHPKPYNVQYWEFGNEVFLTRSADIYVNFLNAFVPALKAVDPSIKIIACGSGGFDQTWNRTVINRCADIIDYISPHHYEDIANYQTGVRNYEAYIAELEGVIAASSNPDIKIYMSEWNVWSGIDWRNGLYAGGMLNVFERHGDVFEIGAPALFLRHTSANDWNNALINFNNSDWFPAPNYVVMKFWREHFAPNLIQTTGNNNSLNVVATLSDDGKNIYFKVINTSNAAIPAALDIAGPFTPRGARLEQIAPPGLSAANSMTAPDNIRVEEGNVAIDNQRVNLTIPKYGAVIATVSQDPTVGVDSHHPEEIQDYRLYANYPNPFNPGTVIKYDVPTAEHVELRIVDVLGRVVTVLVDEAKASGSYDVEWDGRDDHGLEVSSGLYFYELITASRTMVRGMIRVR